MNKQELVTKIAESSELTQKQANAALDVLTKTITDAMIAKDDVALIGFGTFKVTERSARTGRNPSTGKEMLIPAKLVPTFKPGTKLKEAVNG